MKAKTGLVLLTGLLNVVLFLGCASTSKVPEAEVTAQQQLLALQQHFDESEQSLKQLVASATTMMEQLQQKLDTLKATSISFQNQVTMLQGAKDQTLGLIGSRAEEYAKTNETREQALVGKVGEALTLLQGALKQFQASLDAISSEYTAFMQSKQNVVDASFMDSYGKLQSDINTEFSVLQDAMQSITVQFNEYAKNFDQLKAVLAGLSGEVSAISQ